MSPNGPPEMSSPEREKRSPRLRDPSWGQLPSHGNRNVLIADISDTGLRVIDPVLDFSQGDPISMRILAGEQDPFLISGKIIRVIENGYAIQLDELSIKDACWIDHVRSWCARSS